MRMVNCIVHDISLFGIRLEILNTSIKLDTGIKVSIQFKVHKRAEITCEALVRFYSQRKGLGTIAGLEFVQLRPVQQEKINSIVEDLIQHIAMTKV